MKTLYVTDLDGTLMRDDKTISNESVAILNHLIAQGIFLTYATARSFSSASKITGNISFNLPVIILNGTILANPWSGEEIEISMFGEELLHIRQALAVSLACLVLLFPVFLGQLRNTRMNLRSTTRSDIIDLLSPQEKRNL